MQPFIKRTQRQRINMIAMAQSLFLPWILFCLIYANFSFKTHYDSPALCWFYFSLGVIVTLFTGGITLKHYLDKSKGLGYSSWWAFAFLTMVIALTLGAIFGCMNFNLFMQPYYDLMNLNTYKDVDPAQVKGAQLMDAGLVEFVDGARLDLGRSMGFKNLETYCVAPITVDSLPLASYDFWAVGVGCCSPNSADFHCGEYNSANAKYGLRFMKDDQRPFFRLAVQQAEAAYQIQAVHPLFFYFTEDSQAEVDFTRSEGYRFYFIGMLAHFGFQFLCVCLAAWGFSKMGHY